MDDRDEWRERFREIRASSTTWWWWWWWCISLVCFGLLCFMEYQPLCWIFNEKSNLSIYIYIYIYIYIHIYVCVCVCVCVCLNRGNIFWFKYVWLEMTDILFLPISFFIRSNIRMCRWTYGMNSERRRHFWPQLEPSPREWIVKWQTQWRVTYISIVGWFIILMAYQPS